MRNDGHYRGGFDIAGLLVRMRALRQAQTPAEDILWEVVRNRRFHGLKFRRQHQIGLYIVDFYCHDQRLVIELDGEIHDTPQQTAHDTARDHYLRSLGLRIHRIPNDLLLNAPTRVLQDLATLIHPPTP